MQYVDGFVLALPKKHNKKDEATNDSTIISSWPNLEV